LGHPIRMEKWAENLAEVTIGEWLKHEGDPVAPGEAVAELITEKATFKYEPEAGGVLLRIYAPENSTVPVGFVIGYIGEPDEAPPADIEAENQALLQAKREEARLSVDWPDESLPRGPAPTPGAVVRATPAARRLAREAGVSLEEIAASIGEARRISDRDVEAYIAEHGRPKAGE
jgi:pyruvate dehydrogenase E2 component (dihydrolipoyllysine-residue acetyltransferase)